MSTGPTTLQEFARHSITPYVCFYLGYAIFKYVGLAFALSFFILHKKRRKKKLSPGKSQDESIGTKLKVESFVSNQAGKIVHHTIGSLHERLEVEDKDVKDEHVIVFLVHCISFITIAFVIATKMFWTNLISYDCTTNVGIHCFPQILNKSDTHLVPNISLQARTNDCSLWSDESLILLIE